MQGIEQLRPLLSSQPRRIVITSHANPDGDALGSSLALYHYFKQQGHDVIVIMPTDVPDFLAWMDGFEQVCVYPQQYAPAAQYLRRAEILFVLDYNEWSRLDTMAKIASESPAFKVMIDHHLFPKIEAQSVLWRVSASSTCELVYEFIGLLGGIEQLSVPAMEAIFVGILTDTGGFSYSTSPAVYRIAADLVERGVRDRSINDLIFNAYTLKRFQLLVHSVADKIIWLEDINAAIIVLTAKDHEIFNIQRGDTEGIVNFVLKVRAIRCSILLTEQKEVTKISMRSKGSFSVQEICMKYFGGGGHLNASGAGSKLALPVLVQRIKDILYNDYREQLTVGD